MTKNNPHAGGIPAPTEVDRDAAKPAAPEQARRKFASDLNGRPGAVLNGEYWKDTTAAWAAFEDLCNEPAPGAILNGKPWTDTTQPRRARGRAPRMARNTRTRGSRRSSAASRGSPSDDPEPPPSVGPRRVVA
jgi:hypothetical protein